MSNNKIYLNNLDKAVTSDLLKEYFSEYGDITEISLPVDKASKAPKGYAFISFSEEASATKALDKNGQLFLENEITVQIATERKPKK